MTNTIFIKEKRYCVKPMGGRLESFQKLKVLVTIKGCKTFTGSVIFLELFYTKFKNLLIKAYIWFKKEKLKTYLWRRTKSTI